MKNGPEHHVNNVQAISDDRIAGGFVGVQGVFYEIPDAVGERLVHSEVNVVIRHPEVMIRVQSIAIPVDCHLRCHLRPKHIVDHVEHRPKVIVDPRAWIAESFMWSVRVPIPRVGSFGLTDVAPLDLDMSEGLRAEIGHVPLSRNEGGGSKVWEIEAGHQPFVDQLEWEMFDPKSPNNLLNKGHREPNRRHVGRHFEHADDATGVELVSSFPQT